MTTEDPERILVTRAQEGDRAAIDELIGKHRERLQLLARSRISKKLAGYVDVEDIIHR